MSEQVPPPIVSYATPALPPPPPRRTFGSLFGWVLFVGLAIMIFFVLNAKPKSAGTDITLSEFTAQLENGNVVEVVIDNELLRGKFAVPVRAGNLTTIAFRAELPQGMNQNWSFMQWLLEHGKGASIRVENNQNLLVNLLLPLIPWLLIFAFIWFFVFRHLRTQVRNQQADPKPLPVYIVPPENK